MRPRIKVVLLMATAHDLSLWRFRLEQVAGYKVYGFLELEDAKAALEATPDCFVALTSDPSNKTLLALSMNGRVGVLCFDAPERFKADTQAKAFEPAGPELAARVFDRIKQLTARKRGPKPIKFSVAVETPVEIQAEQQQEAA